MGMSRSRPSLMENEDAEEPNLNPETVTDADPDDGPFVEPPTLLATATS